MHTHVAQDILSTSKLGHRGVSHMVSQPHYITVLQQQVFAGLHHKDVVARIDLDDDDDDDVL